MRRLRVGLPLILRLIRRDSREKTLIGRFNTYSGFLYGYRRIHAFQRTYRWAIANGYKQTSHILAARIKNRP